jgi:hypothetical protein
LIYSAPEVVRLAIDPHKDIIEVPFGVSGPVKRKPTVSFKRVISLDLFQSQTVALLGPNSRISICMADFWGS